MLKRLDKLQGQTGYSWYSTTAGLNSISLPGNKAVEIAVDDAIEWFGEEYGVFEAAGDWRERIMGAGSFDEIEEAVISKLKQ